MERKGENVESASVRDREMARDRERQRYAETETETQRERQRDRDGERERERDRDTHRQRHRQREGETKKGGERGKGGKGERGKGVPTFQHNPKALPAPIIRRQTTIVDNVVVHGQIKRVIVSAHALREAVMHPIVMPHLV